ncbi:hypothetical protein ACFWBH_31055 [Streptomyces sp. NPDC059999]
MPKTTPSPDDGATIRGAARWLDAPMGPGIRRVEVVGAGHDGALDGVAA